MIHPTKRVEAHPDDIWSAKWFNGRIVTGSLDGTMKTWTANDLVSYSSSPMRPMGITSVAVSRSFNTAVACGLDSFVHFYDIEENEMKEKGAIPPSIINAWTVSMAEDDLTVAIGSKSGQVGIYSTDNYDEKAIVSTGSKCILNTRCSHDSAIVASVGIDGACNMLDIESQAIIRKVEHHSLPSRSVAFSPDDKLLYMACDDRHVSVLDARCASIVNSFSHSGMALSVDASPDGRHFVVGCSDHKVCYWDIGMQQCVQEFESQHASPVLCVCFQQCDPAEGNKVGSVKGNGRSFLSTGEDGLLQVYESNSN